MHFSTLAVLSLTPALALAQGEDPGLPFEQGDMEIALALGLATGEDSYQYAVGGAFAYYVLPGLAPGLDVTFHGGDQIPNQTWVLVPLKWIVYRSRTFAPYLVAEGGRIFIHEGQPDLWMAGGGPGFYLSFSPRAGAEVQVILYRLFPENQCEGTAEGCTRLLPGLRISFVL